MARTAGINIHIYPSPIVYESRMFRIATTIVNLGVFARVQIVGMSQKGSNTCETVSHELDVVRIQAPPKSTWLLGKIFGSLIWQINLWRAYRCTNVSCVNIHHLSLLLLGCYLSKRHKALLIYDTHELETETSVSRGFRRFSSKLLERRLIRFVDYTFVVGYKIRDWYVREYGLKNIEVVLNFPDSKEVSFPEPITRASLGLPEEDLIFIYQGVLAPGRKIELLLNVFERVKPGRQLVLIGYGPLEGLIKARGLPNVHLLPPVEPQKLLGITRCADVGIVGVDNVCLSYYYSLPNKLLQYLAAGLPVLAPQYPEMEEIVLRHRVGWTVPDECNEWVRRIDDLSLAQVKQIKPRIDAFLKSTSWNTEEAKLARVYRRLVKGDLVESSSEQAPL